MSTLFVFKDGVLINRKLFILTNKFSLLIISGFSSVASCAIVVWKTGFLSEVKKNKTIHTPPKKFHFRYPDPFLFLTKRVSMMAFQNIDKFSSCSFFLYLFLILNFLFLSHCSVTQFDRWQFYAAHFIVMYEK